MVPLLFYPSVVDGTGNLSPTTKHRVPFRFACEIDFVSKTEWGSRKANNGTKKQPRKAAFHTPCIIQK